MRNNWLDQVLSVIDSVNSECYGNFRLVVYIYTKSWHNQILISWYIFIIKLNTLLEFVITWASNQWLRAALRATIQGFHLRHKTRLALCSRIFSEKLKYTSQIIPLITHNWVYIIIVVAGWLVGWFWFGWLSSIVCYCIYPVAN